MWHKDRADTWLTGTYVEEGTNAREIRGSDVELGGEFPLVLGGLVLKSVFSSNVPALDVKSLTGGLKCELVICESGTHLPAVLVAGNGAAALLGLNSAPVVSVFSLCILCSFPFVLPCLLMADGAAFACVSGHGNDLVLGWLISWVHVLVKETYTSECQQKTRQVRGTYHRLI